MTMAASSEPPNEPSVVSQGRVHRLGVEEISAGLRKGPSLTRKGQAQPQPVQTEAAPMSVPQPTTSAKISISTLSPEQRAIAQAQMLGTMQAIGIVLGSRLVLLVAVLIAAGLAFTAAFLNTNLAGYIALGWALTIVLPIVILDMQTRAPRS